MENHTNFAILSGRITSQIKQCNNTHRFTVSVGTTNRFFVETEGIEQYEQVRAMGKGDLVLCFARPETYHGPGGDQVRFRPLFIVPLETDTTILWATMRQMISADIARNGKAE